MKIIVCGSGQVGFQIAQQLSSEGNNVSVIDENTDTIQRTSKSLDVLGIIGHASHPDTLKKAGAADADMLIAATHCDEVNMIACEVAHSLFNIPIKIARIRSQVYFQPQWSDLFRQNHLAIDVLISPEIEVANIIVSHLGLPGTYQSHQFLDGHLQVIATHIAKGFYYGQDFAPASMLNGMLSEVKTVMTAVEREGAIFIPDSDTVIRAGDGVYVCVQTDYVNQALMILGQAKRPARRVIIVGAGHIGFSVSQSLERLGIRPKIIEKNQKIAEKAACNLKHSTVLHGDGLDSELLEDANIEKAEAIIALTNDDKVNMLCCALAKKLGCRQSIALLTESRRFLALRSALDIDTCIDPRATTVSTILKHVRQGRIRGILNIHDGAAELIEAEVLSTSPLAGKEIGSLKLPEGSIIGAILSNGRCHMPVSDYTIQTGDSIVVMALRENIRYIEYLFRVRPEYF